MSQEIIPKRLVMVSMTACDFCDSKTNSSLIVLPGEHLFGLQACKNHRENGIKAMHQWCLNNNYFYLTKDFLDLFNNVKFPIKRSSGTVEFDWKINKNMKHTIRVQHPDKDEISINVSKDEINKWVYLSEICQAGNLNYNQIKQVLVQGLNIFYQCDAIE